MKSLQGKRQIEFPKYHLTEARSGLTQNNQPQEAKILEVRMTKIIQKHLLIYNLQNGMENMMSSSLVLCRVKYLTGITIGLN